MATLFGRLNHFSTTHKLPLPTPKERSELGTIVFKRYLETKPTKEIMHYLKGIDEEGKLFKVRDYPNYFAPTIDKFIQDFYDSLPKPQTKVRKRIAPKPVFTSKSLQ